MEHYHIRVAGYLDDDFADWFDGLALRHRTDAETSLVGPVADQAALHGILARIRDLNLALLSVTRLEDEAGKGEPPPA